MDDKSDEELLRGVVAWGEAMNSRGHASFFPQIKAARDVAERVVTTEFVNSLKCNWRVSLSNIESREPPEPDCNAVGPSGPLTIELKELVDGSTLSHLARRRKGPPLPVNSGQYTGNQLQKLGLEAALNQLINDNVSNPYPSNVDILLIYSDEEWFGTSEINALVTAQ